MPIEYVEAQRAFFLHAGASTYALQLTHTGHLEHLYWGPALRAQKIPRPPAGRSFTSGLAESDPHISLDIVAQEYPVYGTSDFRSPAIEIFQPKDGSRIIDLRYKSHTIAAGKPGLAGLPATYVETDAQAETLTLVLHDRKLGLDVELLYTAFTDLPVIVRSARIVNRGGDPLEIRREFSCSIDFAPAFEKFHFLELPGHWARERDLSVAPLRLGMQAIESRRGASSAQHNPFFALCELGANEEHGAVYGFNLVFSGGFWGGVDVDSYASPRAQLGLNPFDFAWKLAPGESFQTPEAVLVFSEHGLGGMSRSYHRLYRQHLCRGTWRDKPRPILINNWEATYFNFDAAKLEAIADAAGKLGIELFVLDDGWFGKRDNDRSSLGDWVVDRRKLPGGLEDLAAKINAKGLDFGLWFEPEMVSPDSDLYRAYPDWCLHVPDRPRNHGRNQLVLDFSRSEVVDAIYEQMAAILTRVPITYVKWDMNRHMTDIGSARLPAERQQETAHRYMLGVYALMERLLGAFPHILWEGCSGGGARFDPGILHYMPQIWASDNTDAICRLRIQYGTSIVYPWSAISAHVSVTPNHQVGRDTPFRTRGEVAFTGAFGYELDLSVLPDVEQDEVRRQTTLYKELRSLLATGDLHRLLSPFDSNETAWMVVAPDGKEAVVTHVQILNLPSAPMRCLKLRGLDRDALYSVKGTEAEFPGDLLMEIGLSIPLPKTDFASTQWHLVKTS